MTNKNTINIQNQSRNRKGADKKIIRKLKKTVLLIVILCVSVFASAVFGENKISNDWKCFNLLDQDTCRHLRGNEKFFWKLYKRPRTFQHLTDQRKKQMIDKWLKVLQEDRGEKAAQAAAMLGLVKAEKAVPVLEKATRRTKAHGRIRWVSTRSLGQIGDKKSIKTLIELLNNPQSQVKMYAKVSLAEITGVYLGDKKIKWLRWQRKEQTKTVMPKSNSKDAVNELRRVINEKYSYRDIRNVNWDMLFKKYEPMLRKAKTPETFAEIATELLSNAKDVHIWLRTDTKNYKPFRSNPSKNYNYDLLAKVIPGWEKKNQSVYTGKYDDGIGYILINSWARDIEKQLESCYEAIWEFSDARALIIDVRPNSGGSEPLAGNVAGCFVDKPVVYAKHTYREANNPTGFGKVNERVLKPNKRRPKYRGKIAVLTGPVNMSSCEAFLLMMKQVPNCKLIGEKSYGSSANPKPHDLGNGVKVWLPSWKALRPDGTCFEQQGIEPDIIIKSPRAQHISLKKITKAQMNQKDPVLEKALEYLRGS